MDIETLIKNANLLQQKLTIAAMQAEQYSEASFHLFEGKLLKITDNKGSVIGVARKPCLNVLQGEVRFCFYAIKNNKIYHMPRIVLINNLVNIEILDNQTFKNVNHDK